VSPSRAAIGVGDTPFQPDQPALVAALAPARSL
jgi:hypothetical protein